MSNWKGYFFKAVKTNEKFPNHYINYESFKTTPNAREEIKAYRDDNTRNLTRVTAKGHKTSMEFETLPNLHLKDKIAIQDFFTRAESNATERKITLEYWNDEENQYKTSDFYRGDIQFTIKKVTEDDIVYKESTIKLVEY